MFMFRSTDVSERTKICTLVDEVEANGGNVAIFSAHTEASSSKNHLTLY